MNMTKIEIVTDNVYKIEAKRKKSKTGFIGGIIRFLVGLSGVILMLIGGLLCLTIVGIPIGFGAALTGIGMVMVALRRQKIECPACKKVVNVIIDSEDFTCPRCKKVTIIEWN